MAMVGRVRFWVENPDQVYYREQAVLVGPYPKRFDRGVWPRDTIRQRSGQ